jgi:hypothetical protein
MLSVRHGTIAMVQTQGATQENDRRKKTIMKQEITKKDSASQVPTNV